MTNSGRLSRHSRGGSWVSDNHQPIWSGHDDDNVPSSSNTCLRPPNADKLRPTSFGRADQTLLAPPPSSLDHARSTSIRVIAMGGAASRSRVSMDALPADDSDRDSPSSSTASLPVVDAERPPPVQPYMDKGPPPSVVVGGSPHPVGLGLPTFVGDTGRPDWPVVRDIADDHDSDMEEEDHDGDQNEMDSYQSGYRAPVDATLRSMRGVVALGDGWANGATPSRKKRWFRRNKVDQPCQEEDDPLALWNVPPSPTTPAVAHESATASAPATDPNAKWWRSRRNLFMSQKNIASHREGSPATTHALIAPASPSETRRNVSSAPAPAAKQNRPSWVNRSRLHFGSMVDLGRHDKRKGSVSGAVQAWSSTTATAPSSGLVEEEEEEDDLLRPPLKRTATFGDDDLQPLQTQQATRPAPVVSQAPDLGTVEGSPPQAKQRTLSFNESTHESAKANASFLCRIKNALSRSGRKNNSASSSKDNTSVQAMAASPSPESPRSCLSEQPLPTTPTRASLLPPPRSFGHKGFAQPPRRRSRLWSLSARDEVGGGQNLGLATKASSKLSANVDKRSYRVSKHVVESMINLSPNSNADTFGRGSATSSNASPNLNDPRRTSWTPGATAIRTNDEDDMADSKTDRRLSRVSLRRFKSQSKQRPALGSVFPRPPDSVEHPPSLHWAFPGSYSTPMLHKFGGSTLSLALDISSTTNNGMSLDDIEESPVSPNRRSIYNAGRVSPGTQRERALSATLTSLTARSTSLSADPPAILQGIPKTARGGRNSIPVNIDNLTNSSDSLSLPINRTVNFPLPPSSSGDLSSPDADHIEQLRTPQERTGYDYYRERDEASDSSGSSRSGLSRRLSKAPSWSTCKTSPGTSLTPIATPTSAKSGEQQQSSYHTARGSCSSSLLVDAAAAADDTAAAYMAKAAVIAPRHSIRKGKGKGKAKTKKGVTRKTCAGANKTTEPEIPKSLERPEEGYWDNMGVWQDGGEEGDGEMPSTSSRPAQVAPPSTTPYVPPTTPSPPSLPQPSSRSSRSNKLSPRSLMMFAEVPIDPTREPLFLPSASEVSDEDDLEIHSSTTQTQIRHSASLVPSSKVTSRSDTISLPSPIPRGNGYITPLSDNHSPTRTRKVLGELPIHRSPPTPPTPPCVSTHLRRNQTYSTRVRRTYAGVPQEERQLSQTVYNPHLLPSSSTSHHLVQAQQPVPSRPIWSRVSHSDDEELVALVDDMLTPEPEEITPRRRYCSTQQNVEVENGDHVESEPVVDLRKPTASISSDTDEEMEHSYDKDLRERRRRRKRARREHQEIMADYYENEGEPDLYGERLFATDSLESRNWSENYDYGRPLHPLTSLRNECNYFLPPRTKSDRNLFAPRDFRDILPVILEEDERHRLKFTQTRREFMYGDAKNHKKAKRKEPPRRRRTPHGRPRHQVRDAPRPIDRITVQELRERYQLNGAKPFPVDSQLIRAGHRAASDARKPAKHRRALAGGRVHGIRLPGDPRIVQSSNEPDERIESNTQSISTQVPPLTPAERFHHSTPGRLLLQPIRGRAAGRANPAPGGVSYPPLPFTTATPPTRSTTHASRASTGITATGRHAASSGNVSRVLDSVRTGEPTGRRRQPPTTVSQRSSQSSQLIKLAPPTQYGRPALGFWNGEQEAIHDFEPEERLQARTPEPEDVPEDDRIFITMDNGEEILVSKSEIEGFMLTEALHEMAQPMSHSSSPHDHIEQFGDQDSAPALPMQGTRHPLEEIDLPEGDQFSGLNMTAYLLRIAGRVPQAQPQKTSRELKLDERRQRLEAKRREGETSHAQSIALSSGSTQPRSSQRQPPNRFSQPQPGLLSPEHYDQTRPTQSDMSMVPQPYENFADSRQLPEPVRAYRSVSEPTLENSRPPLRRTKTVNANVAAPFKRPTRLNATPPPEPTFAERIQLSIAQAVPAYAALRPRRLPSPPPLLGVRMTRTRSMPYPPQTSTGPTPETRATR
ncbi:hypothetical protein CspHIS471_0505000 [Cutaneotrichosporon sp. HIS471]|nr:hypothetical protein CspHIS471_0505000 [Cutaneotrichosporon sp. HIS471]